MMPFDPTVAIVFGTMLCALVLSLAYAVWYQSLKRKTSVRNKRDALENSVGLKELEGMMRRTMEESLRPLQGRFDALEAEVHALQEALDPSNAKALPSRPEGARRELTTGERT